MSIGTHARTAPDGFEALKDGDGVGVVGSACHIISLSDCRPERTTRRAQRTSGSGQPLCRPMFRAVPRFTLR